MPVALRACAGPECAHPIPAAHWTVRFVSLRLRRKHVLIPDSLRDEAIKAAIDHKKKADEASDDDEKMAPAEEGKKA